MDGVEVENDLSFSVFCFLMPTISGPEVFDSFQAGGHSGELGILMTHSEGGLRNEFTLSSRTKKAERIC